ncbi:thiamine-phosphate kinase [Microbacterium sp. RD1]|uniref:thiamine-phosphate kinase n=1 Tax=Microbacterium sp. RD1 TaxID=3457313 RepID=UPI003FA59D60
MEATVGQTAERDVLRRILDRLPATSAVVGPGDDAAVLAAPDGRVVATTDTLVHGPDFRLAWSSPFELGWKAAAVNLSDVAAMGARPTALLVALALPEDTLLTFVDGFADGLVAACAELAPDCAVEGGDLTVSETLTIAVTALGSLGGRSPVLRSGARPGDEVRVVGELGVAGRGLAVLFDRFTDAAGAPVPVTPAARAALPETDAHALARQLAPHPPVWAGTQIADAGATALMDVSDGLALDATRLAEASGVTIDLASALLGPDPATALSGGEDHALLFTVPTGSTDVGRRIGAVQTRGARSLTVDGAPFDGHAGWDPYRDWDAARG